MIAGVNAAAENRPQSRAEGCRRLGFSLLRGPRAPLPFKDGGLSAAPRRPHRPMGSRRRPAAGQWRAAVRNGRLCCPRVEREARAAPTALRAAAARRADVGLIGRNRHYYGRFVRLRSVRPSVRPTVSSVVCGHEQRVQQRPKISGEILSALYFASFSAAAAPIEDCATVIRETADEVSECGVPRTTRVTP